MKKLMISFFDESNKKVSELGMKDLINLPSYNNKTIGELLRESKEKKLKIGFNYKDVYII